MSVYEVHSGEVSPFPRLKEAPGGVSLGALVAPSSGMGLQAVAVLRRRAVGGLRWVTGGTQRPLEACVSPPKPRKEPRRGACTPGTRGVCWEKGSGTA